MRSLLYLFLIVAQWVPKSFIVEGSVSCVPSSCACDECPNMNVFCASSRAHCSDCAGNYCVSPTPSPSTSAAKASSAPSQEPAASPTRAPTQEPVASPTRAPTEAQATAAPSQEPAASPTRAPTQEPVASPTRATTEKAQAVPSTMPGGVGGGDDGKVVSHTHLVSDAAAWGLGSVLAVLIIGCFAKLVLVTIAEDGKEKIVELKGSELQPTHGGGGDGSSPIVEMVDNSAVTAAPKKSTGAKLKKARRSVSSKMAMKRAFSFTPGIRTTTLKSENNSEIAWNSAATAGLSSNMVSDGGIGQEIRTPENGEYDEDGNPIVLCAVNEYVEEEGGRERKSSRSQRPPADEQTQSDLV